MILVAANSRSASSNTMQASLPPSSICNGIIPAFFDMAIPVSQPPVKLFHNNKVILIWVGDGGKSSPVILPFSIQIYERGGSEEKWLALEGQAIMSDTQTCYRNHFDTPRVVEKEFDFQCTEIQACTASVKKSLILNANYPMQNRNVPTLDQSAKVGFASKDNFEAWSTISLCI